jgi:rod shape-determining protein MreD
MAILAAVPILGILLMLQLAVISRLPLINGTADLLLLALVAWALQEKVKTAWIWAALAGGAVTIISGLPYFVPLIGYLLVTLIARLLQRRVWQTPILAMFLTTILGTILYQFISIVALQTSGVPIAFDISLTHVMLPSALLNVILALPMYIVISDIAHWIHPGETG